MLTKNRRSNLTTTLSTKTQTLLQNSKSLFSISKEKELQELKSEFSSLSPSTELTMSTLIQNSTLKREIKLPEQDFLLAQITAYSYLPPEKRPYQLWEFYLEPLYNSIFHCIYLNHKEKICIIGYRGTDFKNRSDLISDAQIILGVNAIDPRVTWSIELFDQLRTTHGSYKKRICGHSLWGTLCYIVAKHRNVDYCCTFNPGSAPNKIFLLMLKDTLLKKPRTKNIHTYKIMGDPVSLCSYVGQTVSFFVPSLSVMKLHSIDNFFKVTIPQE